MGVQNGRFLKIMFVSEKQKEFSERGVCTFWFLSLFWSKYIICIYTHIKRFLFHMISSQNGFAKRPVFENQVCLRKTEGIFGTRGGPLFGLCLCYGLSMYVYLRIQSDFCFIWFRRKMGLQNGRFLKIRFVSEIRRIANALKIRFSFPSRQAAPCC